MAAHGQTPPAGRVRLGELLVKAGVITDLQLKAALAEQKQWGGKLGDILVRMRYLSEDIFVRALSKQLGLPRADLAGAIPLDALARVPGDAAEEYEIVPVALLDDGKTLAIATSDPLNVTVLDTIRSISKLRITPYVAGASAIRSAIGRLYRGEELRAGGDEGQLQILSNSVDEVPQAAGVPARGQTTVSQRPGHTTASGLRPVQPNQPPPYPAAQPAPYPTAYPAPNTQPYAAYAPQPGPVAAAQMPTPLPMQLPPQPMVQQPHVQQPLSQQPLSQQQPSVQQLQMQQFQLQQQMQAQLQQQLQQQLHVQQQLQAQLQPLGDERREAVALRALVELLVQKGVFTLDEYLARLKR